MTIEVIKAFPTAKRSLLLPNLARRKPVRRSLFGEVDHEESMRFLNQALDSIKESDAQKWNFNFVEERPIRTSEANYEWMAVHPNEEIHKSYALGRLPFLAANASDSKESESNVEICCEESPSPASDRLPVTTAKSVQRTMPDFYPKAKKRSASVPPSTNKTAEMPLPDSTSDLDAVKAEDSVVTSYHSNFAAKRIRHC